MAPVNTGFPRRVPINVVTHHAGEAIDNALRVLEDCVQRRKDALKTLNEFLRQ